MDDARITLRHAAFDDVPPRALYGQLQVRSAAFVVEQQCIYLDLDGKDLEPGCVLWWHERGGEVLSTIRVLVRDEERVIGRVATAPSARGLGLAGELIRSAIAAEPSRVFRLGGQWHLARWYASFGFERDGRDYMEDRIPHTPMVRHPVAASRPAS